VDVSREWPNVFDQTRLVKVVVVNVRQVNGLVLIVTNLFVGLTVYMDHVFHQEFVHAILNGPVLAVIYPYVHHHVYQAKVYVLVQEYVNVFMDILVLHVRSQYPLRDV
jgi:hypothetical protein